MPVQPTKVFPAGPALSHRSRMTAAEYTDWSIQQNLQRDLDAYSSLDPAVQQDIQAKYRLLHERVKDAGLFDCPYSEYGKETCRYSMLFASFLVALNFEWYMTSACFLGLFWMPQHNLRKGQVFVREFCNNTGTPYSILGFTDSNRKVLSRLEEVSNQHKIMLSCQNFIAKTGESGLQ
ncbi:fatty acid desaturase [Colletotrichum tabaci]|uniref:Fatty acid desaturase n=1 Tax=Colletotrichum tabaci TaxID=1209068 RepID=A0AAV9TA33_9PEZI